MKPAPVVRPPLHLHLILDPGPKHGGRLCSPTLLPVQIPRRTGARPIRASEGERSTSGSKSTPWQTRVARFDDSEERKNSSWRTETEKKMRSFCGSLARKRRHGEGGPSGDSTTDRDPPLSRVSTASCSRFICVVPLWSNSRLLKHRIFYMRKLQL
jgi:hypothetical protein